MTGARLGPTGEEPSRATQRHRRARTSPSHRRRPGGARSTRAGMATTRQSGRRSPSSAKHPAHSGPQVVHGGPGASVSLAGSLQLVHNLPHSYSLFKGSGKRLRFLQGVDRRVRLSIPIFNLAAAPDSRATSRSRSASWTTTHSNSLCSHHELAGSDTVRERELYGQCQRAALLPLRVPTPPLPSLSLLCALALSTAPSLVVPRV